MFKRYPTHFILLLSVLAGWLLLSFYNVLTDDDIVMLRSLKERGFLAATIGHYDTWNTRWMSFLFLHSWMTFLNEDSSLFCYHSTTLIFLVLALFRFVCALVKINWLPALSLSKRWFFAGCLSSALITATYHIGDTWFWMNTSTMYGWNLIVIIFATAITIMPFRNIYLQICLILLSGLYTGGASEPAIASLYILLPAFLLFRKQDAAAYKRDTLLFLLGMSFSFAIALAGEGHGKREAALPNLSFSEWIIKSIYFSAKMALYHSPLRVLTAMALLLPVFEERKTNVLVPYFKITMVSLTAWITVIVIHAFFITRIMGDYGPERAWSFISLWTVLVSAWWLKTAAGHLPVWLIRTLSRVTLLLVFTILTRQFIVLPSYHRYLLSIQKQEILFDPANVPTSGLLHQISMDPFKKGTK